MKPISVMLLVKCFAVIGNMFAVIASTVLAPAIISPSANIGRAASFRALSAPDGS